MLGVLLCHDKLKLNTARVYGIAISLGWTNFICSQSFSINLLIVIVDSLPINGQELQRIY